LPIASVPLLWANRLLLIGCIAGNVHGNNAAIGLVIAMGQIMLAGLMVGLGLAWSMARKALRASS